MRKIGSLFYEKDIAVIHFVGMVDGSPDLFSRAYESKVIGIGPDAKPGFLRHTGKFDKHQLVDLYFIKQANLFYFRI
jgi:hypothetical protein